MLKKTMDTSMTMRLKLFLLLIVLVVTMLLGMILIFTVTGTLTAGVRGTQKEVELELTNISQEISDQYGLVSAHTVEFSKNLSASMEKKLAAQGLTSSELKSHPEVLEDLVAGEYERSLFTLQRSNCSGIFIILDATVNTSLPNSQQSKAGLYLKNMEPNSFNSSSSNIFLFRGFSEIGRQNSVTLHSQWKMEFDVSNSPYYSLPIKAAANKGISLSRLYYWTPALKMPGTTEEVMLCSVPLIDSKGNVFGVCGLEVSEMLFKLSHMPDNGTLKRLFCIFAPSSNNSLNVSQALFAGGYYVREFKENERSLAIKSSSPFNSYQQDDGALFSGLHKEINIYPEGSAFANEKWIAALLIPDEDIAASITKANLKMTALFLLLLVIGISISYYISKRYISPFARSIEIIKSNNFSDVSKTNIAEIDDLMEYLSANNAESAAESKKAGDTEEKLSAEVYEEFAKNTKKLSPAERAVFNLYVEGYTAKQIAEILCLSINTIKTHNKRIYMKLNVSSREELLLYVNMLKEAGREFE